MPVCTSCASPAEYIYTTYRTKSNIRLGVCHPPLILVLDLILLKSRVYLHLLFNRGTKPYDADRKISNSDQGRHDVLRHDLIRLATITILGETFTRCLTPHLTRSLSVSVALRYLCQVVLEISAQHFVTLSLALLALWAKGWYPVRKNVEARYRDGRQINFTPIVIPLTLLYSTILPLLLQLVLQIWTSENSDDFKSAALTLQSRSLTPISTLSSHISERLLSPESLAKIKQIEQDLSSVWAETDKIWAGSRLLGGMSAGFGLRVTLPTRPWETTAIVLGGWGAGALIGRLIAIRNIIRILGVLPEIRVSTFGLVGLHFNVSDPGARSPSKAKINEINKG